jgi:hypothetical protein
MKKPKGRPKKNEEDKVQYQLVAVYKDTHKRIKKAADNKGTTIVKYLDKKTFS